MKFDIETFNTQTVWSATESFCSLFERRDMSETLSYTVLSEPCSEEGNYYVTYRRRSAAACGEQVNKPAKMSCLMRTQQMDNFYVIHFNPELAKMFAI